MKTMKTTFKEKLNTTSAAIQTQGQKAFKHPITSILSLCLVAGIAATIAGFSQAPTETTGAIPTAIPNASITAPAGTTLPVSRTLTSADGRTIDVTILSKSPTAIKAARADGKSFEIALDKLSEVDRAFVAELVEAPAPPVKKPTLLFIAFNQKGINTNDIVLEKLKHAGFDVDVQLSTEPETALEASWAGIDAMEDAKLKGYDIIWEECGPHKRLLALFPTYKGVMVMKTEGNNRLKDFLADKTGSIYGTKPHVKVDGNLIRYHNEVITWVPENGSNKHGPIQPEFIEQAIAEVKKQLKK